MGMKPEDAFAQAIAVANSYTDETVAGGGAIKGKNCTIQSNEPIEGGNRITFQWTLDDGTVETDTMDVMNGEDGTNGVDGTNGEDGLGIKSVDINSSNHLIVTYDDDTTHDAGEIESGSGTGDMDASTYDPNGDVATAGGIDGYVGQVADNIKDGLTDVNNPDSAYKKDLLADSILYGRYVEGKYVSTSNGAELDSATLCASNYYDLEDAVSISFKFFHNGSAVSMNVVYYDENHSYINGFNGAAVEKQAIPYNARYARFNFFKEELDYATNKDAENHYVYLYYENPKAKAESQLLCGNIVENIVAAGKYKNGYYISTTDGAEQANAILSVSDYIDIHHVDSLIAGFWYSNKNQSHSLCVYDENKNKIAGYAGAEQTISLPSNAYYVRFNLFVAEITGGVDQSKHFLYASSGQRTPIQLITHTVVAKPLQFDGADLVIFGDSIAKGYASNPLGVIDNPWATQFATRANANLNNRAASGTTLAVRDGRSDSIYEKVSAFTDSADIIIVAGGTNDYGSNVPLGNYTDATTNTVYGALNGICDTLKTNYPNVPVIFITPINRSNLVSVEEIGYFNSIRNAVYEKATANGYYVIDGVDLGFPDVQGAYQQAMIYDNLHPTVQGHKMYADAVSDILLSTSTLDDEVQDIQNKLDEYVLGETPNVYDSTKDLIDMQLTTKGATSQSANVNTSDYIDITTLSNPCVAATVRTGSQNLRFCFYDADKVNLGSATTKPISIASNDESLHAIEPPQEAVYIRFHYYAPSVSKIYVGEYDESYIYVPHELYLKSSKEVVTARKDYATLNARLNAIEDNLPSNNKVVEYWGDSLTQGNQDLTGVKRSTVLSSLLGSTWVVKNYGVGGEQANTIAARAGGVYVYVNNITIPADTSQINVNDSLVDAFGEALDLGSGIYSSNYESWPTVNPCLIDGIECQLTKADLSSPVMLNRVTAGEAHAITRPTAIIMHSNTLAKDPVLIICIGQNRGFNNSADELISLIDGIIEARKSTRYIVVGMVRSLAEDTWQAEYNAKLKTKYGNHYLDIEKYLKTPIYDLDGTTIISSYGLQDNGLTPTEADLQSISNNRYPLSLLASDELHLNQYGYTAWANREYLLGEWLGYWE